MRFPRALLPGRPCAWTGLLFFHGDAVPFVYPDCIAGRGKMREKENLVALERTRGLLVHRQGLPNHGSDVQERVRLHMSYMCAPAGASMTYTHWTGVQGMRRSADSVN